MSDRTKGMEWMDRAIMAENELAIVCAEVAKVYCHITNGRISKANTRAEDVISVHDDICSEENR